MIKVVAAVIEKEGKILFCQRAEGGNCSFLWEFPGGKIEEGETPEEALIREIKEELDIEIKTESLFDEYDFSYPEKDIHFYFIKAKALSEKISLNVHADCRWLEPAEAKELQFCPADVPVFEKILKKGEKHD